MLGRAAFLAVLTFPCLAAADPTPSNHRIGASVGVGGTLASADVDGHWRPSSAAPGLALQYLYAPASILEIGADVRYWNFGLFSDRPSSSFNGGENGIHHGLAPSVELRLHTRGRLELGATLGGGLLVLHQTSVPDRDGSDSHAHTWLGWQGSIGIDARYWIDSRWAVFGGPSLMGGHARDGSGVHGFYLREDALFASLQAWLGVVYAP